ncbi:hypothetical protein BBJ28_00021020 [Nothophytophthora sp. Chile5]|nr:hypothetical protein BBJ28_00021020 [Nothophytophthora sp. Chile5]
MARGKKSAPSLKASTPSAATTGSKKTAGVAQKKQAKAAAKTPVAPKQQKKAAAKSPAASVGRGKKGKTPVAKQEVKEQEQEEAASETESSDDADDEDGEDEEEEESDDEFEDQGSSSDDDSGDEQDGEEDAELTELEKKTRRFTVDREKEVQKMREDGSLQVASQLHIDDLSSDDEENINTIGNVPLRWYEDYDHIGYDVEGKRIMKTNNGDGIDNAIAAKDDPNYEYVAFVLSLPGRIEDED